MALAPILVEGMNAVAEGGRASPYFQTATGMSKILPSEAKGTLGGSHCADEASSAAQTFHPMQARQAQKSLEAGKLAKKGLGGRPADAVREIGKVAIDAELAHAGDFGG